MRLLSHLSKTFSYGGLSGRVNEWGSDGAELVVTGVVLSDEHDNSNIIARFEHFTIDLIATVTSQEDLEEDNEVIRVVFDEKEPQTSARSEVLNRRNEEANASVLNSFKSLCKCEKIEELFDCTLLFRGTIGSLDGKLEVHCCHKAKRQ